eukprot:TCONS_00026521-protein
MNGIKEDMNGIKEINENEDENKVLLESGNKRDFLGFIDIKLIPVKVAYICYYAATGAWWPFMILFLTSLGLNPFLAGLCICLRTAVSTFAAPFWGFISDYTGRQRLLYVILTLGMVVTILPAPFVATQFNDFDGNSTDDVSLNPNATRSLVGPNYCTTECGDNRMFHVMVALFISMGLFEYTLPGFIDSNVMSIVSNHPLTNFGHQRVFGSIGFAIGSLIAGAAADHFKHDRLTNFAAAVFIAVPFLLVGLPFCMYVATKASKSVQKEKKDDVVEEEKLTGSQLAKLTVKTCFRPYVFVYLISVLIEGVSLSFMYSFLFLHMKDEMQSTDTILGLNIAASIIGELLFFPLSKLLIARFGSMECLVVSMFVNGIRFILLAYCKNAWLTLPIQLLHGVGFALFFAAMIEIAYNVSPKEISATMFGIICSLLFSVSNVVGNLLGGWIYKTYLGVTLFMFNGALCCCWSVVIAFYYFLVPKCRKQHRPNE